jgi:hypothetical protein
MNTSTICRRCGFSSTVEHRIAIYSHAGKNLCPRCKFDFDEPQRQSFLDALKDFNGGNASYIEPPKQSSGEMFRLTLGDRLVDREMLMAILYHPYSVPNTYQNELYMALPTMPEENHRRSKHFTIQQIANNYISNCKAYDESFFTGKNADGSPMPKDRTESYLSSRHAFEQLSAAANVAIHSGFTMQELLDAVQVAGDRPHEPDKANLEITRLRLLAESLQRERNLYALDYWRNMPEQGKREIRDAAKDGDERYQKLLTIVGESQEL